MRKIVNVYGVGERKAGVGKKSGKKYDFTEISIGYEVPGVIGVKCETVAIDAEIITVEGSITSVDYACSLGVMFYAFSPLQDATYTFRMTGLDVTFYIPTAFAEDWENGETQTVLKTNEMLLRNQEVLLNNLQDEQELTNEKLDTIIDPDVDTSGADGVNDDIGQIDDFEQSQQDVLEEHTEELLSPFDFASYATALAFVSSFVNRAYMALGEYSIVIMLPIALGLLMFICSRVRYLDKPNKHNEVKATESDLRNAHANKPSHNSDGQETFFD